MNGVWIIRVFVLSTLFAGLSRAENTLQIESNSTCNAIITQASRYPPSHAFVTPCCSNGGVKYECINGYRRVRGDRVRMCMGGTLTGEDVVCGFPKVLSCGNPGPINNGYFVGSKFNIGEKVKYRCYPGFTLRGHSRRKCLHNGMWSEPPRCVLREERRLDIDNAANVVSKNILHDLYEPKCAEPGPGCKVASPRKRRALNVGHEGGLDLIFLFDGSSAVKKDEFKMGLRFAQQLVRILDATVRRGGIKIGAVTYATNVKINFHMSLANERSVKKIWAIKKPGGCGSNLGKALYLLRRRVLSNTRKNSKRTLFIVTNGRLVMGTNHKKVARLLKNENHFDIFGIGVGKSPNKEVLMSLVSDPVRNHVITLKYFSDVFGSVRKAISAGSERVQCGISGTKPKSRTVRGNKATSGVWPWQIGIYWDRGRTPICGGALIGDQWVLTAAHCFYSSARKAITWPPWRYTIVAGDHKISKRASPKQMVPVGKIFVNKDYRYRTHQSDIALVKLQYKFKLGKYIRPVCMPSANHEKINPSNTGKQGFVADWDQEAKSRSRSSPTRRKNRSRVAVHTALVISSASQCANITRKPFNASYLFCASDGKGYKHTCRGDGGSPFVSEKYEQGSRGYRWTMDGLVSWDEKCGSSGHYAFFTRVGPYVNWINRLMKETRRH